MTTELLLSKSPYLYKLDSKLYDIFFDIFGFKLNENENIRDLSINGFIDDLDEVEFIMSLEKFYNIVILDDDIDFFLENSVLLLKIIFRESKLNNLLSN